MDLPLSRTVSTESTQSWQRLTTASGASAAGRKARSSEPETGGDDVQRASVSVPLLGAKAIRQSLPSRRPSQASNSSLFEYFGHAWSASGSAVDESDATPTEVRGNIASAPVNPLLLPDSFRLPRSDVGSTATDSKRLSISSFVSAISNSRGYSWSGRSSVVGSESEGTSYEIWGKTSIYLFTHWSTDSEQ
jgi:inositol hexakisphosphate/diphosphoinositol-pentakisphosphate kinase